MNTSKMNTTKKNLFQVRFFNTQFNKDGGVYCQTCVTEKAANNMIASYGKNQDRILVKVAVK